MISKKYVKEFYHNKAATALGEYKRGAAINISQSRKVFEDWLTIKYPGGENESVREEWMEWFDYYMDITTEADFQSFTIDDETVYGYCIVMENEETLVRAAEEQTTEQAYAADEMLLHQIEQKHFVFQH